MSLKHVSNIRYHCNIHTLRQKSFLLAKGTYIAMISDADNLGNTRIIVSQGNFSFFPNISHVYIQRGLTKNEESLFEDINC